MSMKSCGVLERNCVETPIRLGLRLAACATRSSVCFCRAGKPEAAAVLDHELEAAGDAEARDRRRAEHRDLRVLDLPVANSRRSRAMIAVSRRSGLCRFVERLEDDEHRAEVGAVGRQHERHARDGDGVRHARRRRGRSCSTWATASWVRCSDAESGSWTLTISRPWSCCGTKPVGRRSNTQ